MRKRRSVGKDLRTNPGLPLNRKQMVEQRGAVLFRLGKHELEVGKGFEGFDQPRIKFAMSLRASET